MFCGHLTKNGFVRYIVDGETMHDPELPALKTEAGHYNNMVKLRPSSSSQQPSTTVMVVKAPKLDNLKKGVTDLAFAAKAVSQATVVGLGTTALSQQQDEASAATISKAGIIF